MLAFDGTDVEGLRKLGIGEVGCAVPPDGVEPKTGGGGTELVGGSCGKGIR